MPELFNEAELGEWLSKTVTTSRARIVERVVWGWLSPVLGTGTRPDPVSPQLFAWAIELGGIAHENPAGLSAKQIGPFGETYSAERRNEILAAVASQSPGGEAGNAGPIGDFPPAPVYPDPARW